MISAVKMKSIWRMFECLFIHSSVHCLHCILRGYTRMKHRQSVWKLSIHGTVTKTEVCPHDLLLLKINFLKFVIYQFHHSEGAVEKLEWFFSIYSNLKWFITFLKTLTIYSYFVVRSIGTAKKIFVFPHHLKHRCKR